MKKKIKNGVSVASAISVALTMFPVTMFSSLAAEPIAVAMPVSMECTYRDAVMSYKYDGENVFSDAENLGYTLTAEEYDSGKGSGNELGEMLLNGNIVVEDDGKITGTGAGTYHLTAHLKEGYVWKSAEAGKEKDDLTVEFTVKPYEVKAPVLEKNSFIYNPEGAYDLKIKNPSDDWYMDTEKSELNKTEAGTYTLYFILKDNSNTVWDDANINPIDDAECMVTYTIKECTHFDEEGNSTYNDGICELCGEYKPAKYNNNHTSYDYNDDFYEIYSSGEFAWYLADETIFDGAVLYSDVTIDCDKMKTDASGNILGNSKENNWRCIDGQGHIIKVLKSDEAIWKTNNGVIKNIILDGNGNSSILTETNNGTIENCAVWNGASLCKDNKNDYFPEKGTIKNSYTASTAYGSICTMAVEDSVIEGCACVGVALNKAFLNTANKTDAVINEFTEEQAKSGYMAVNLGEGWYQNIDIGEKDNYPVPNSEHGKVYYYQNCKGESVYTNYEKKYPDGNGGYHTAGDASGGYCTACGEAVMVPEKDINGVYQVKNLAEFIYALNEDTSSSIALTADIDFGGRSWTKISEFSGKINGQGHLLKGLKLTDSLFGTLTSTASVSDLGIAESEITDTDAVLCDVNNGEIKCCFSAEKVPLAKENTISCFYLSDEETTDGGRTAKQFESGKVAYELRCGDSSVWGQRIGTDAYPKCDSSNPVYRVGITVDFDESLKTETFVNSDKDLYNDIYIAYESRFLNDTNGEYYSYVMKLNGSVCAYSTHIYNDCEMSISRVPYAIDITGDTYSYTFKYMSKIKPVNLEDYIGNSSSVGKVKFSSTDLPEGLAISDDGKSIVGTFKMKAGDWGKSSIECEAENGSKETLMLTFTSIPGDPPEIILPENISVTFGKEISETELPDGWIWKDGTQAADFSTDEYEIYKFVDNVNYDYSKVDGADTYYGTVTRKLKVKVTNDKLVLDKIGALLNGGIGYTYVFIPTPEMIADEGSYIKVNDEKYLLKDLTAESDGSYTLTHWINAKEMTDKLTFVPYGSDDKPIKMITKLEMNLLDSYESSVADYLNQLTGEKEQPLAKAILNYGTYSQIKFGYNTDKAVYTNDSALASVSKEELSSYKAVKSGTLPEGIEISGMSLVLKSNTVARIVFYTEDTTQFVFSIDGKSASPVKLDADNCYCLEVQNILANNLAENHTIKINDCTYTISALSYAASALENSDDSALVNAAKALYLYYKAASEYATK